MAFTQHGSQDYTFGFDSVDAAAIAAAIGLKPQTLSLSYEPEFTAEAQDEEGETASVVVGQDKISFTMSGYITDEGLLEAAASFEYDGRFYIVMGRKIDHSNTEFRKGELSGTSWAKVTAPDPGA
jgi:hypothetical protein